MRYFIQKVEFVFQYGLFWFYRLFYDFEILIMYTKLAEFIKIILRRIVAMRWLRQLACYVYLVFTLTCFLRFGYIFGLTSASSTVATSHPELSAGCAVLSLRKISIIDRLDFFFNLEWNGNKLWFFWWNILRYQGEIWYTYNVTLNVL